ncbi:beta-N-acetylhexosaminidase [Castellaniella sp.]|uniref:beta-N-acetylhexosaminidase n=1 Tax=Castellaniella sp. TaxID=1955812 RepID=UPI0035614332
MNVHVSGWMPGPVMVDVAGFELTAAEVRRLTHPQTGGVILFARNFADRDQLLGLCQSIHAVRDEPLLIAVDHEGGRVQRFRTDGFTAIPPMRSFGRWYDQDPQAALHALTEIGFVLASELRACGVDLSFTPVLDLDYGPSQVIGDRALHDDPAVVALLARALVQGLGQAGMAACGKHFPGHGAVAADSHLEVPVDARSLGEILDADAAPYAWLGDLVLPAVMPAHVIYSQVAPEPAGFSQRWITDILRNRLQYDGVVFSDDLTMEGARVAGDIHARAQAALQAGCDMVLVCNRPDLADALLERLADQPPQMASVNRVRRLRPSRPAPSWAELLSDARYVRARSFQSEDLPG